MTSLGERIRSLRHERDLTLKQLGATCGLSHPFLSQVERDLANPSLRSLEAIARALGVPITDLWARDGHAAPLEGDIERWRLDEATRSVEAVMVMRYGASRSEETTDQARTLANAALVAIDDCRGAVELVRTLGSAWRANDDEAISNALVALEDWAGLTEQGVG